MEKTEIGPKQQNIWKQANVETRKQEYSFSIFLNFTLYELLHRQAR